MDTPTKKPFYKRWWFWVLAVIVLFVVIGAAGGGAAQTTLDGIKNQVAEDAVEQYGIAKRNGTKVDICVHAGLVSAAYIQAKDEVNYQKWKATEKADCAAAGMPSQD